LAFWQKRDVILDSLGKALDAAVEQRVQLDLLDLAILGAELRVRRAGQNQAAARREALQMLAEAQALFGPNVVLFHERRAHAEARGRTDVANEARRRAEECPPRTAWEHYALGRSLLQSGAVDEAALHLERAAGLQPDGLWPNFYWGICCYRLGRFEDSA